MSNHKKTKKRKKKKQNTLQLPKRDPFYVRFLDRFAYSFKKAGTAVLIIVLLLLGGYSLLHFFTIDTIIVEGNVHYSNEEIQEMVMGGKLGHNSIYLSMKYRNRQIEDVPFVETMDVNILSPNSIKITVYEKSMAGFVEYMGQYFYFDKDGTVVESSAVKTMGVPQIKGLTFDHIILLEKLPVEDENIFKHILDISQLLEKYGISAEQIYFDKNYDITLYFGQCRIKLGNTDYIDEKIMKLKTILPNIEDKKGILRMENYTSQSTDVTFELEN